MSSLGTHNLLWLALNKKARILVASTSEVYGDPLVHPQTEEYLGNVNPVGPRGVYDEAKRLMEAMTMASPTTAWRHRLSVYSIHMRTGMKLNDCRVLLTNIGQVLRGEDLTIFDDGSQTS